MQTIGGKKDRKLKDHDSSLFFKDHAKVAEALLQSLEENDTKGNRIISDYCT
jgi:hypothetical protein